MRMIGSLFCPQHTVLNVKVMRLHGAGTPAQGGPAREKVSSSKADTKVKGKSASPMAFLPRTAQHGPAWAPLSFTVT